MIVTLTGATVKESGKNKWLLVQYTDDKGQAKEKNIFATQGEKKVEGYDELAKLIEKGEARGKSLDLEMTKTIKDDKTYWNVIAIKEVGEGKPDRQKPAFTPSDDTKPRSMALSYSKDLVVAGKIDLAEIEGWADYFLGYILGGKVMKPEIFPETPQSTPVVKEPAKDSKPLDLAQEAIKQGAEHDVTEIINDLKKLASFDAKMYNGNVFAGWLNELDSKVKAESGKVSTPFKALSKENQTKFVEKVQNELGKISKQGELK